MPALARQSADPIAVCAMADSQPRRVDREAIVTVCDAALASPGLAANERARLLVVRAFAHWRLDNNAEAERDAREALKLLPGDADALLARGVAQQDQDKIDAAAADFETVLKADPRNKLALVYRGGLKRWNRDDPKGARVDYDAALAVDPRFVQALLRRADLLMNTDLAAAERDARAAVAIATDDSAAWMELGSVMEAQDRPKEAFAIYDQIVRKDPKDALIVAYRGVMRLWLEDPSGALRDADLAIAIDPKMAYAQIARGRALAALKRDEGAAAAYRKAAQLQPAYADAWVKLAQTRRRQGKQAEGLAAVEEGLKGSPKDGDLLFNRALLLSELSDRRKDALAAYDAAIEAQPTAAAYYNRAQLRSDKDDHKGALADYRKAAELAPNDPDALNGVGMELSALNEDAEGELKAYDAALAADPKNTDAVINKAIYYADREAWPKALEQYQIAVAAQPERADLRVGLADTLTSMGRLDAARVEYDRALRLDPKRVAAWGGRAWLNQLAGRLRDAKADYDRAIVLAPDDAKLLVGRASALRKDDKGAAAMADLNAAVKLQPRSAFVLNNRGLALAETSHLDEALADYGAAIAADPDYEPAYYNRAGVFMDQDRYDRAIRDLNVSLRLSPGDAMTLSRKGRCYWYLKDYRRALEELDAALAANPGDAETLRWRAKVKTELGDIAGAQADVAAADKLATT
ncbi:MAG: tetratricopeptide repeat protein [Caulobacter sp.]|nr:tetratricopeptide repeat protein [Caulobacter sp.]